MKKHLALWQKISIVMVAVLIVGIGGYLITDRQNTRELSDKTSSEEPAQTKPITSTATETEQPESSVVGEPDTSHDELTFTFVDISSWQTNAAKDGSYQVMLSPSATSGTCKEDKSVLMVGMIYMNLSGEYDCNGILSALTATNPQLTRAAFGVETSSIAPENPTRKQKIKLITGTEADRYEYVTNENDKRFNNIKYIAVHNSKTYIAHMRWADDYNVYADGGGLYSPTTFDTIAQKTWRF